jgi:glycosyltransferase involved in cell wall biosynthesis
VEAFLASVARQTILDQVEVVLVHNEPSERELLVIRDFQRAHPGHLQHHVVRSVEPQPVSLNRGLRAARGDVVTLWDVDNVRADDGLERQLRTLDEHHEAVATYGDYCVVPDMASRHGQLYECPPYDQERFTRGMHTGPFPMWRKVTCERAGLFDEQLLQVADFDLMVRLAFNGPMLKTEGLLGWYVSDGPNLSTRPGLSLALERTVVELRYGMYRHIDLGYWPRARDYAEVKKILTNGALNEVAAFVPGYAEMMRQRMGDLAFGLAHFLLVHVVRRRAGRLKRWLLHEIRRLSPKITSRSV